MHFHASMDLRILKRPGVASAAIPPISHAYIHFCSQKGMDVEAAKPEVSPSSLSERPVRRCKHIHHKMSCCAPYALLSFLPPRVSFFLARILSLPLSTDWVCSVQRAENHSRVVDTSTMRQHKLPVESRGGRYNPKYVILHCVSLSRQLIESNKHH